MKTYERRFVLLTMSLVGAVLLTVFTGLGVYLCRNHYLELKNLMEQVLRPMPAMEGEYRGINEPADFPLSESSSNDASKPDREPPYPERPAPSQPEPGIGNNEVLTVLYHTESNSFSLLSGNEDIDEAFIEEAALSVLEMEDGFHPLPEYGLYYYKENAGPTVKIAFVERAYLTGRILSTVLFLVLAFLISSLLFLLISLKLSKLAVKPVKEAMQRERQFVDDVSHDLKTPITVILANTSILKKNGNETVQNEMQWIDSTGQAAKNMMAMVNEMLTLSSLETSRQPLTLVPVDLSSAVEKASLQMESLAYEQHVTVEESIDSQIFVSATKEYAERIAGSLLENALKYEPSGGTVRIRLYAEKKKAVLTVQNTGSRIDGADLPHIFERFYRADRARSSGGHGLGLPILKEMVSSVRGEIRVTSNESDGTIFTVLFDLV